MTGVAIADWSGEPQLKEVQIYAGQLDLSLGSYDTGITRLVRFREFLQCVNPDVICFEEVKNSGARGGKSFEARAAILSQANNLIYALISVMSVWAHDNQRVVQHRGISEIKKFATGAGNAGKPQMIEAANRMFGTELEAAGFERTGADNIADALFLCDMAMRSYSPEAVRAATKGLDLGSGNLSG